MPTSLSKLKEEASSHSVPPCAHSHCVIPLDVKPKPVCKKRGRDRRNSGCFLTINSRTLTFCLPLWLANYRDETDIQKEMTDCIMDLEYSMRPKSVKFQVGEDSSFCLILPGSQSVWRTLTWKQAPTSGLIRETGASYEGLFKCYTCPLMSPGSSSSSWGLSLPTCTYFLHYFKEEQGDLINVCQAHLIWKESFTVSSK